MKKFLLISVVIIALLFSGLLLGPKPDFPSFDANIEPLNLPLDVLQAQIIENEANTPNVKPDNEARIIWADSLQKTPYSVVYLHGFSASQVEADPIHREFAKRYGCNLYLSRLAGHGTENKENFLDLTPKSLIETAKHAIQVGQLLGEKVIVMSCSTGGTLSAYLAAHNPDLIDAQILYSPNIEIYDGNSKLLTYPWGLQLARWVSGSNYRTIGFTGELANYWTNTYRIEGIVALQGLLDETMKEEVFNKISQPLFVGYYYKNEDEQDKVVSVEAIHDFFSKVSTPFEQKSKVAFPNTGNHVISCRLQSKDVETVREKTYRFAESVLGLTPINKEIEPAVLAE